MTTESSRPGGRGDSAIQRDSGMSVLAGAAVVALVVGSMIAALGALVSGDDAAYGAAVGTLIALVVFGFGAVAVNLVAGVLPGASLGFAALTYLLQLVLIWASLSAVESSGLLATSWDRTWLGAALIVGSLAWILGQLVLHLRRRIPAFDLSEHAGDAAGPAGADGDAR